MKVRKARTATMSSKAFVTALSTCGLVLVWMGAALPARAEDELPRLSPRITQHQVEHDLSLRQIRIEGRRIFSTPFNEADGLGDGPINPGDKISPGGRPALYTNGIFLRMNGLDSQTCLECHNYRSNAVIPAEFAVGGGGGVAESAFPGVTDPDIDDSENNGWAAMTGRMINPPFIFGASGVEALGKEMTKTLQAQKRAAKSNPGTVVDLVAKGVSFGTIVHDGTDFDYSGVEGIADDLVVRPFGRTGCCATVREFDIGAMQFHHGIQPIEVVDPDVDADGDGVANELLVGELSAMHIFQMSLERPRGKERLNRQERDGLLLFRSTGCASCHRPKLPTESRFLTLSLPEKPEDPEANPYFRLNLTREAPGFEPEGSGVAVQLFADLKLHDMGRGLEEGDGNTVFTTARLWGVADSAPYMHDGRSPTIADAILAHGGEGQDAADEFAALTAREQDALLAFLRTLRAPPDPNADLKEKPRKFRRP